MMHTHTALTNSMEKLHQIQVLLYLNYEHIFLIGINCRTIERLRENERGKKSFCTRSQSSNPFL